MSTILHWINKEGFTEDAMVLVAVPGVGNVGKLVIETINRVEGTKLIARILHPDLPPHSVMEDGLLVPPHLSVHSVPIEDGKNLLTITGNGQPMTPRGQHEMAETILKLSKKSNAPLVLVLAGLSANPGEDQIHLTCSSNDVLDSLTSRGVIVSVEQPSGGMLGMAGLVVSLAPIHGVQSAAYCAETVGLSVDVVTADRLASRLSEDFEMGLVLPIDNTSETAARLLERMEGKEIAGMSISDDEPDTGFYV
ncbi:MAG: PAC2 family protein [Candidatus Thermoplasmatota archaeon]|nr:PAC2 family protein [Candidatus Thermoplasmatota archaeon]MEC9090912.1 PAC2 family protein [Candidatus Thermoplasmatota archaeon]MED5487382.1 PAC2 family protein [Candidatus Thermoplasmatota archaeon]